MPYTNSTTNYHLPQYLGSDKPTYLGDFNTAMDTIDGQMKDNHDKAFLAQSAADEAKASVGTLSNLTTTDKSSAVAAINEVNATAANAAVNATAAIANVGTLANLTTTDKTSAVAAINEINAQAGGVGDLSTLTTTDKSSAVAAINEVNGKADDNKTAVETLVEMFNLTPTGKTITASTLTGTVSVCQINSVKNTDGSLAKIYGTVEVRNATETGSFTNTITISDTGIYPDQDLTINGWVTKFQEIRNPGSPVEYYSDLASAVLHTDGTITVTVYMNTVYQNAILMFANSLLFIKDFSDPYIPPEP